MESSGFLRRHSLRLNAKLSLLIALVSCVVLVSFSLYDYFRTKQAMQAELAHYADRTVDRLLQSLRYPVWDVDWTSVREIMRTEMTDQRLECVVFKESFEHGATLGLHRVDGGLSPARSCAGFEDALTRSQPLAMDGRTTGVLTIKVGRDHIRQQLLDRLKTAFLELLVLLSILAVCLYVFLRRLLIKPMSALSQTTATIAETQDYSVRAWVNSNDELGQLTESFNQMLDEIEAREKKLHSYNLELERDVAARTSELAKQTRRLEQANTRLRELDKLKSAFLSTVSHDLRTPLTSILGFARLIDRDFVKSFMPLAEDDPVLDKKAKRIHANLAIIGQEGERLTRLINDFLDLSRIESGRIEWRDQTVQVQNLVNQAVEAVQGQFSAKESVDLRVETSGEDKAMVCDPDRMLQVLVNLLNNAAKFTEHGAVTLRAEIAEGLASFEVEDTGKGIPQDQLDSIFDKFHKVEESDTKENKPSGTGLGLSICKQIVNHYRGRIWADSEPGKGSAFRIQMPTGPEAPPPEQALGEQPAAPCAPLILVVDDDDSIRCFFRQTLEDAGYRAEEAASGEEALERAKKLKPDLIVMDLRMPGMGGEKAIQRLRDDPGLSCPSILVTSVLADARTHGADAQLAKPVDPETFLEAVDGLLRSRQTCRPLLVLGEERLPESVRRCAGPIERVDSENLALRLQDGFQGTVVMPMHELPNLDVSRIPQDTEVSILLLGQN
jgi:signal transduction histidine kinase/CheY-like chemotaxis protein